MDRRICRSEPYAKIITGPRIGYKGTKGLGVRAELQLSSGAVREYNLRKGERVNIFWDRDNEVWNCPVLILRRGGSHRILYGNTPRDAKPGYLKLSIGSAINQLHIPLLKHKLPILDYVDNEIWIDFTPKEDEKKRKRAVTKEVKTERFNVYLGQEGITIRWGAMYKSVIEQAARIEGLSMNALILRATSQYIEDRHPDIWHSLDKIIKKEN